MDQSLPPRPALFLRLMLILKPSRFRQLFSNLWVTHPTLQPLTVLNGARFQSALVTQIRLGKLRSRSMVNKHSLLNSMPVVAAMPERFGVSVVIRWDEFYTARSATTTNENGIRRQYAMTRRVVQRSSALLVLESPWMSLTRDALWHNGLSPPREGRAREGDSPYRRVLDHTSMEV
jgi:hypothetical protein